MVSSVEMRKNKALRLNLAAMMNGLQLIFNSIAVDQGPMSDDPAIGYLENAGIPLQNRCSRRPDLPPNPDMFSGSALSSGCSYSTPFTCSAMTVVCSNELTHGQYPFF